MFSLRRPTAKMPEGVLRTDRRRKLSRMSTEKRWMTCRTGMGGGGVRLVRSGVREPCGGRDWR